MPSLLLSYHSDHFDNQTYVGKHNSDAKSLEDSLKAVSIEDLTLISDVNKIFLFGGDGIGRYAYCYVISYIGTFLSSFLFIY